jgi:hypothetical protein
MNEWLKGKERPAEFHTNTKNVVKTVQKKVAAKVHNSS